jgi:folate-binding Fe-S cluster repair protein YgfZ
VRTGAGVIDRALHGVTEFTGRDRAPFLHAMLTNDVEILAPGASCAAAFVDVPGKVLFVVTMLVLEDRIVMPASPGTATVEAWIPRDRARSHTGRSRTRSEVMRPR